MNGRDMLSPKEIADVLATIAEVKGAADIRQQLFLAILAGVYIGFGAVAATIVTSGGGLDAGFSRFLGGSVFSVGLMLVLIPGSELFTGNVLMTVGFLSKRVRLPRMLRNWAVVWAGNFVGAIALAWVMNHTGQFASNSITSPIGMRAVKIAEAKLQLAATFWPCFLRGVLCNMLVCLAVIMACSARTVSGKILGIYFPIMTFVACGFEHSIANMYFLPAGLMAAGQFSARFLEMFRNLIPVTLGNIVGGLALVLLHPGSQAMISRLYRRRKKHTKHKKQL
ncbi:MAG: formate/nitrite transporter family protein [Planctomycetes bacterium]|nr:formate/nitrite transporter family protein [Planctomycetota bacterium]